WLMAMSASGEVEVCPRQGWDASGLPPFDRHLPLLSLPLALRIFEPLPMTGPYLRADPELRTAWRARLGPATKLRVGLAWSGSQLYKDNRRRSMDPEQLLPLLQMPEMTFYNL